MHLGTLFCFYKNVVFPAQVEYSYFSAICLQYLISPEQGSKNVPSGSARKVDFLAGQVTFKA